MKPSAFVHRFDLDVNLRDAALDEHNRPTRRAIANIAIGMDVEDAYYSARELREAVEWVHEGFTGGKKKLTVILANRCDDFQRALYYALAGRGVIEMLDDLLWLEGLLEARGRVAAAARRAKVALMPLVEPYVAKQADGPVAASDPDFEQGPSWWLDPGLECAEAE